MTAAVLFGGWTVLAFAGGLLLGRAITLADLNTVCEPQLVDLDDWLADQPCECLTPEEIDHRFQQIEDAESARGWWL